MKKSIWFYDEIYKTNILFVIGSREDCKKYVKKQYDINLEFNNREEGKTFDVTGYGIIIWMLHFRGRARDYGVLMHEIIHASLFIIDGKFKIDADNSEPFNYHCEWIMRKFLELNRSKK